MSKVNEGLRPSDFDNPNNGNQRSERGKSIKKRVSFKGIPIDSKLLTEPLIQRGLTSSGEITDLNVIGFDEKGRPECEEIIDLDQILWNIVVIEKETLRFQNPHKRLFLLKKGWLVTGTDDDKFRRGNLNGHTLVKIDEASSDNLIVICSINDGKRLDFASITFKGSGKHPHTEPLSEKARITNLDDKINLSKFETLDQFRQGIK